MRQIWVRTTATFCLFMIVGFGIYANSLKSPFFFDSSERILENPNIRITKLSIENLRKAAFDPPGSKSRPIANLSFALNYYFHKYTTTGYHIINILIHIITAVLLYTFLQYTLTLSTLRMDSKYIKIAAFFAAMLWLTNPLHTQSVTYIVQRANSMAAMFYLASFCLYIRGKQSALQNQRSWPWFVCASVSWIVSLGCKQNTALLPFFIFIYEWFFYQNLDRSWLKRRIPLILCIIAVFALVAFLFLGDSPMERINSLYAFSKNQFDYSQRVLTQTRVVFYYLALIFSPRPAVLNIDHDFPLSNSIIDPITTLFSLTGMIFLLGVAIFSAKKNRLLSFTIIWYFGNHLIESSFIPLDIIFEHRTYIPSMLVPLMPVIWLFTYVRSTEAVIGLLVLPSLLLSYWTYERNEIWKNKIAFWQDSANKSPKKARPQLNLGIAYAEAGEYEKAKEYYRLALKLDPDYVEVYNNMANVLLEEGANSEAEKWYLKAIEKQPAYAKAHFNLANLLREQGKTDGAIRHLHEALRYKKKFAEAYLSLGNIYEETGQIENAYENYVKALQYDPGIATAHYNIGKILIDRNDTNQAEFHFREALKIDPTSGDAALNLGIIAQQRGDMKAAAAYYQEALANEPENPNAHYNRARLYMVTGDKPNAEMHLKKALQYNSELVEAHVNLGFLLEERDQAEQALEHYKMAIEIDPTHAGAQNNIGNILAKQHQYESALPYYQAAIRLDPKFEDAHVNLGIALLRMGDAAGAEEQFRQALQINPSNPGARQGMAILQSSESAPRADTPDDLHRKALEHAGRGEYQAAVELFKKILSIIPSEPGTCYNIACMYAKMGDTATAVEWLERAIQNGYDNWEAIKNDPDLDGIRQSEAYKALVKGR